MLVSLLVIAISAGAEPSTPLASQASGAAPAAFASPSGGSTWQPWPVGATSSGAPGGAGQAATAAEFTPGRWQWNNGQFEPIPPAGQPGDPAIRPTYPLPYPPAGAAAIQSPIQPAPGFTLPASASPLPLADAVAYYDPFTRQFAYGNAGHQPYYLGWYFYDEVPWTPTSPVSGVNGSFQDLQYNTWARYASTLGDRYLFTWSGIWNTSWWTGPSGVNLPGSADQLISDFQISSLYAGPWNWQVGIAPQLDADFRRAIDRNAYMVDGRFVLFYQASPTLRLAGGVEYWNRVRGILIPYGGILWSPDDRWEFRLFFPNSRISRYYGKVAGRDVWNYATLGYEVNAWQVTIQDQYAAKTRMQMSDMQLVLGTSAAAGNRTAFLEGGLIFDRHVLFRSYAPSFSIHDNLVLRLGLLW